MKAGPPLATIIALLLVGLASGPAIAASGGQCARSYDPSEQPPFGGRALPPLERPVGGNRPPGHELSTRDAIAIAAGTEAVREELAESPGAEPEARVRGTCFWEVEYVTGGERGGTAVAEVLIEDPTGRVLEAWNDHQVEVKLARGYDGAVAGPADSPFVWIPLCVLFVLPFFDSRRPLRLLHLDLVAVLALSVSLLFFNRGEITLSAPLVYPILAYLFVRMLLAGLRPRPERGALVPLVPITWLAIAALLLAGGRIALNVVDSQVIDIGLAGVVGAERIERGEELYEGGFNPPEIDLRGDVYGPANYLAYLPFEQALPWSGEWDDVPAAHAAAIAFDLLTAVALFLAGRRLRGDGEGTGLGVALSFAWLACPWTLYTMNASANDALIGLLIATALAFLASPAVRGVLIALGSAVKFGPLALAPLFATGTGERRWRSALVFSLAFIALVALVTLPFLPDGGPRELYDRTFGYQASRGSPFSVWGLEPALDSLETLARAFAVVLGLVVALYPARRNPVQVAALGAAVIIALEVGATHWFYFYVVWFLPLLLFALFAGRERIAAGDVEARPPHVQWSR
jgi:hypothetical protein